MIIINIYTSYFGNLKNISKDIVPIAICGKSPNWYEGLEYKKLAPKYKFFMEWKENKDNNFYIKHYYDEVLNKLYQENVLKDLYNLSDGKDVVLLCYEKSNDFCHRHLFRRWYNIEENKIKEI